MHPRIWLDTAALRDNVAALATLGAPVAAVVKNDGYRWGARPIARAVDDLVESYFVADDDELAALRPATRKPVRLLGDLPAGRLARAVDLGGIPNVGSREALAEAAGEACRRGGLTIRVGVLDAAGWSTLRPEDVTAFAGAVVSSGGPLAVELWTHVASERRAGAILDGLIAARQAFEAAGVRVVSLDAASTAAARRGLVFDRLRAGLALFGSRLGASVDNRCALRVHAPVVRRFAPGETGWALYGDVAVASDRSVAVLRCGYGDGFAKGLADGADILNIGMQYMIRTCSHGRDPSVLIDADDDVDRLAARAGVSSHEFVVGLGTI